MGYWLDYSAAKLTAAQVLGAGHSGVIRYIDSPDRLGRKHTNKAEYDDFVRNGVPVLLVFEISTTDAEGGWNRGVEYGQRAKAGADYLGYYGPIFFCNDKTTVSNARVWTDYLDGAASVLGRDRIGAYGFGNAIDTAIGHATYFWQAGRRSEVRAHAHMWQDNNVQVTVGGITCDRNLVIKEINTAPVVINGKEDDTMGMSVFSYEPKLNDKGEPQLQRFVLVAPQVKAWQTVASQTWLSVKSGWGPIDWVHIYGIKSKGQADGKNAGYPIDKEWKNVPCDSERVNVAGVDGMDQYSVEVISRVPFGITLEWK